MNCDKEITWTLFWICYMLIIEAHTMSVDGDVLKVVSSTNLLHIKFWMRTMKYYVNLRSQNVFGLTFVQIYCDWEKALHNLTPTIDWLN
jgi:hypothetical protein